MWKIQTKTAVLVIERFSDKGIMLKHLLYNSSRLQILFFTLLCLVIINTASSLSEGVEITPENKIVIVNTEIQAPDWKKKWDKARELAREGSYPEAKTAYLELLEIKPHIEEVKWELSKVYVALQDYQDASLLLDALLEQNNSRIDYLISAGDIALKSNKQSQAVLYFGQALELQPDGNSSLYALGGLIRALIAQGKETIAIPLMEQLYQSGGETPDLLLNLARFLMMNDAPEKACYYYEELINKYRVTPEVMREVAEIFEENNKVPAALQLWEEYIKTYPDDFYVREKLIKYYLEMDNAELALPHILVLLDNNINREEYLLTAGRIYLLNLGRTDKALSFFETYEREFPDGVDVSTDIDNIRLILANDFLSIVENDGVWMLWRDLAKISPDRVGIYRAMADLLQQLGKEQALIEVLQIISIHVPQDLSVRLRLARLYLKNGDYSRCLMVLNPDIETSLDISELYLLRAECEREKKDDLAVLANYQAYLRLNPSDSAIRNKAIKRAGLLGAIDELHSFREPYDDSWSDGQFESATFYAQALLENELFSQFEGYIASLPVSDKSHPSRFVKLVQLKAEAEQLKRNFFAAEQILREAASRFPDDLSLQFELAQNSIIQKDSKSAKIWLDLAEHTISEKRDEPDLQEHNSVLNLLQLEYLELKDHKEEMIDKAVLYLNSLTTKLPPASHDFDIFSKLVFTFYSTKGLIAAQSALKQYQDIFKKEDRYKTVSLVVEEILPISKNISDDNVKQLCQRESAADLFEASTILLEINAIEEAEKVLLVINEKIPGLTRSELMKAKISKSLFDYSEAIRIYQNLVQVYPEESFFHIQIAHLNYLKGNNKEIIAQFPTYASHGGKEVFSAVSEESISQEQLLQLARALWAENKWNNALSIYETLESSLENTLQTLLNMLKENPADYFSPENLSWERFIFKSHDSEILDQIMASAFFADNISQAIASVTSPYYANYKMMKIIGREYEAKDALNSKKFYQAEKNYQEIIEEPEYLNVGVYPDMATVYSRLGRYEKETEMLEKIKEIKMNYPLLQEAVEKNERERQPQLSLSGIYNKEDGRQGYKNIIQKSSELKLRIMPTIYQDTGFTAARNIFSNTEDTRTIRSNSLHGQYAIHFTDSIQFYGDIGAEDFDDNEDLFILYDFTLKGQLDEQVNGHLRLYQLPVYDTISSLEQGVYYSNFEAGVTIDYLPRLFLGFDFTMRDYSDGNEGRQFDFWTSYQLFLERGKFDFSYFFKKIDNTLESGEEIVESGGVTQIDYWSPGNYWSHILSAEYRQEFWPVGRLQSGTSYGTVRYGIGYESENDLIQEAELNIFLEINHFFLLKGTFATEWSQDYDRILGYASLIYRW